MEELTNRQNDMLGSTNTKKEGAMGYHYYYNYLSESAAEAETQEISSNDNDKSTTLSDAIMKQNIYNQARATTALPTMEDGGGSSKDLVSNSRRSRTSSSARLRTSSRPSTDYNGSLSSSQSVRKRPGKMFDCKRWRIVGGSFPFDDSSFSSAMKSNDTRPFTASDDPYETSNKNRLSDKWTGDASGLRGVRAGGSMYRVQRPLKPFKVANDVADSLHSSSVQYLAELEDFDLHSRECIAREELHDWIGLYNKESESFTSKVIHMEMRLEETIRLTQGMGYPNVIRAITVCELLDSLVLELPRFKVLERIVKDVKAAIFVNNNDTLIQSSMGTHTLMTKGSVTKGKVEVSKKNDGDDSPEDSQDEDDSSSKQDDASNVELEIDGQLERAFSSNDLLIPYFSIFQRVSNEVCQSRRFNRIRSSPFVYTFNEDGTYLFWGIE